MPIVVKHGGSSMIALGREAAKAQAEARAATIEEEAFREHVLGGINRAAGSLADGIKRIQEYKEREKDRELRDTISKRSAETRTAEGEANRDTRLTIADLNNQTRETVAGMRGASAERVAVIRGQSALDVQDRRNEGAMARVDRTEEGKDIRQGVSETGLMDRKLFDLDFQRQKHEREMKVREQDAANRAAAAERRKQLDEIELRMKAAHEQRANQLHDSLESRRQSSDGQMSEELLAAHLEIDATGRLSEKTLQALGSRAKTPIRDDQFAVLAATDPRTIKRIAGATYYPQGVDPITKKPNGPSIPVKDAAKAMAAIQQLPMSPRFTRDGGGVDYYTNLRNVRDKYEQAAMPEVVQQLDRLIERHRAERFATVLPKVQVQINALPRDAKDFKANRRFLLQSQGISDREYLEWAEAMAANPALYGPARPPQ